MFNDFYSNSVQYDPFSENILKFQIPSNNKTPIDQFSYLEATKCILLSKEYFNPRKFDYSKVLIGDNSHDIANLKSIFPDIFFNFPIALCSYSSNINLSQDLNSLHYHLQLLLFHIHSKNYRTVISISKGILNTNLKKINIIPILGYLSSLCIDSDFDELYFFEILENSYFPIEHISYYQKIFDELEALTYNSKNIPLLKLLLGDTHDLEVNFPHHYHIFPKISSDITKILNQSDYNNHPKVKTLFSDMMKIKEKEQNNLPELKPLGEGIKTIPNIPKSSKPRKIFSVKGSNAREKALSLIHNSQWADAVSFLTEALTNKTQDSELYQHRSYALMQLGKIHDALNDIIESIKIKPSDKRYRLCATLWYMLGEYKQCKSILEKLDDKNEILELMEYCEIVEKNSLKGEMFTYSCRSGIE